MIKKIVLGALAVMMIAAFFFREEISDIRHLQKYSNIFKAEIIEENFRTLDTQYPSITIPKTSESYALPQQLYFGYQETDGSVYRNK